MDAILTTLALLALCAAACEIARLRWHWHQHQVKDGRFAAYVLALTMLLEHDMGKEQAHALCQRAEDFTAQNWGQGGEHAR